MVSDLPTIVAIVAGHGEVTAVPVLIRRIASELDVTLLLDCPRPIRVHQYGFTGTASERVKCIEQARARVGPRGAILVLIDSEGEPPCQLGPHLLEQVRILAGTIPVGFVLAHQEYEAWFLAAASSLSDAGMLRPGIEDHSDPEGVRDAKGWLNERMQEGKRYEPTRNQAGFTARFNISAARRVGSFDKCYREIERLVQAVTADRREHD